MGYRIIASVFHLYQRLVNLCYNSLFYLENTKCITLFCSYQSITHQRRKTRPLIPKIYNSSLMRWHMRRPFGYDLSLAHHQGSNESGARNSSSPPKAIVIAATNAVKTQSPSLHAMLLLKAWFRCKMTWRNQRSAAYVDWHGCGEKRVRIDTR